MSTDIAQHLLFAFRALQMSDTWQTARLASNGTNAVVTTQNTHYPELSNNYAQKKHDHDAG